MIFPLSGMMLGAVVGAFRAKSKGGNARDMLQWASVFAIVFGLIGLFLLVFIERAMV